MLHISSVIASLEKGVGRAPKNAQIDDGRWAPTTWRKSKALVPMIFIAEIDGTIQVDYVHPFRGIIL